MTEPTPSGAPDTSTEQPREPERPTVLAREPVTARRLVLTWVVLSIMASADAYGFWNTVSRLIQRDSVLVGLFVCALALGSVAAAHEIGRQARNRKEWRGAVWIGMIALLWLGLGLVMSAIRAFGSTGSVSSGATGELADTLSTAPDTSAKPVALLFLVIYLMTGALAISHAYRYGSVVSAELDEAGRRRRRLLVDIAELEYRHRLAQAQATVSRDDLRRDTGQHDKQRDTADVTASALRTEAGHQGAMRTSHPSATDAFLPPRNDALPVNLNPEEGTDR